MVREFLKNQTIDCQASLLDVMRRLDEQRAITLFVVKEEKIVGAVTDGDIRRGLIKGIETCAPVTRVMNTSFCFVYEHEMDLDKLEEVREMEINYLPVLSVTNDLVKVIDLRIQKSILPLDACIMAGGEGKRLRPMTLNTPKPLLKVGDKPIIEHNIDRLISFGIVNFSISVNYLGEQLEGYFGDGKSKNVNIKYVHETKPLGTIGALSQLDEIESDYLLLMNSDLLTDIDFEEFYRSVLKSGCSMGLASVPYKVSVPYAVLNLEENRITSFQEKPTYTYYSNAGIYLIRKDLLKRIPKGEFYDATDFMDAIIASGEKIYNHPILGYWLDIGKPEDYIKAQKDIERINF